MSSKSEDKQTPSSAPGGSGRYQSATFIATGSSNLTVEKKRQNAERIVRQLGFASLDEFNKYDAAVQAAKAARRKHNSPDES